MKNSKTGEYVSLDPVYVSKSMKSCFEKDGGGIDKLMELWGDAEVLYGEKSFVVRLRDEYRAVYSMIPLIKEVGDRL